MFAKLLRPNAQLPTRANPGDAGYDLAAVEGVAIPPRGKAVVPTGVAIAIPEDTYARVAPRSGLAAKHSIHVGAGVVDSGYRGEIKVVLFNLSDTEFVVSAGDRIAQIIVTRIATPDVFEVDSLPESVRGEAGFGSSGTST